MTEKLHIKPRYYRWHVDPGKEWLEKNTGYAHLDWQIPLNQTALVLVDVWDRHYLKDPQERAEKVIRERLVPLVRSCRMAGMPIIHAPSPPLAAKHPAWVHFEENTSMTTDAWPPADFRSKSGEYSCYARPAEPRADEVTRHVEALTMHPLIQPEGTDVVIATGEELHRYCEKKGILFLFFAGFNTNACILLRDYGTLKMSERGYEIIVVRDCGTGMESFETQKELWQTRGAILFLEMFGKYSVTSEELVEGLK